MRQGSQAFEEAVDILPRALSRAALEAFREAAREEVLGGDAWTRASADPIGYLRAVGVETEELGSSGVQVYLAGGEPRTFHSPGPKFGSKKEQKNRPICLLWAVETKVIETEIPPGPVDGPWGRSFWTVSIHHCVAEVVFDQ
jgi:hypothetical protein